MSDQAPITVFGYQCEKCKEFHWMNCFDTNAKCGKVDLVKHIGSMVGEMETTKETLYCGGKLVYDGMYELVKQDSGKPANALNYREGTS